MASSCAFLGINTRGKAYIAPITSLHWKPSIELNVSATNLALSLNDWRTAVFSWKWQHKSTPSYPHNIRYRPSKTYFPKEKTSLFQETPITLFDFKVSFTCKSNLLPVLKHILCDRKGTWEYMNFYMCVLRCHQKLNFQMLLYNVHITCDVWSLTPSPVTTMYNNQHYYSKHLPISDWLKPHTIHHNQLLLTKFEKYFVILNQWCQKCSPLQVIERLTKKTWGQGCVIFGEQKKNQLIFSFKSLKIFWIKKLIIQ